MSARLVYWDACVFIGLLNSERGKEGLARAVWEEAQAGTTLIVTSYLTFAEVFKAKCEGPSKPLAEEQDTRVEQLLRQKFIRPVLLDEPIAVSARRLLRQHPECRKPADGIHLATALRWNVKQLHTFDGADLLALNGRVMRLDGAPLEICTPQATPPQPPGDPLQRPLF